MAQIAERPRRPGSLQGDVKTRLLTADDCASWDGNDIT